MHRQTLSTVMCLAFSAAIVACSAADSTGADSLRTRAGADGGVESDEEDTGRGSPSTGAHGADGGAVHSGADAGAAQSDAGVAAACAPTATTPTFTPSYKPPITTGANTCTDAQLTAMAKACFGQNGTSQTCDAFFTAAANKACQACLVLPDAAPQFGALIPNFGVNVYGCVALIEGNATTQSCGAKIATTDECASRACPTCADQASFDACANRAASSVCQTYAAASQTCVSKLPQTAQTCLPAPADTQEAWAKRVASLFCGPR